MNDLVTSDTWHVWESSTISLHLRACGPDTAVASPPLLVVTSGALLQCFLVEIIPVTLPIARSAIRALHASAEVSTAKSLVQQALHLHSSAAQT